MPQKLLHQKHVFFLLIFLAFFVSGQAQYIFEEGVLPAKISLHQYAEIAEVGQKDYTVEQVLSGQSSMQFKPVKSELTDLGFTSGNYWVKFELVNATKHKVQYFLETARPVTDVVELYSVDAKRQVEKQISGDLIPFSERCFSHRKCILPVVLLPNSHRTYYIHLKSDGEVLSLSLTLHSSESLLETSSMEQFIYGLFFGILIIASIIYLFFFFVLRERTFLFYSLYVASIGLMQFSLDGYFHQYIMPESNYVSQRSVLIFAFTTAMLLGRYSQLFLKTKIHTPTINSMMNILYVVLAASLAILLFVPAALSYSYPLANLLGLMVLILIVSVFVRLFYLKVKVDTFYKIGIMFLILGLATFILNNLGQLPTNFVTQNSTKIGIGIEVIFLSLSMANLIGLLKSDREKFNRIALERSEEMNEMKSYFLSNISHELRTPLNAIMTISNDMIENVEDLPIKKQAQVIKYSSHSLLSSINDILDFSKIAKGEIRLESVDFEPLKVLEHIKNNAAVMARDKGLDFVYSRSAYIPEMLSGDVIRLGQIVNNVFSNAVKFTQEGFVKFSIECEKRPDNKVLLSLTISDSGVGISKVKMESIFDSFTQHNINNKRKFGGLGLGLYIVKSLVDMKGGSIDMTSVPNGGTTCKITLEYEISKGIHVEADNSQELPDLHGKSILVVEDNAINQIVIKMITKSWKNTSTVYVNNGVEALDALRAQHFDIVLMDLQMPIMDGYEATRAIRAGNVGDQNRNIPIIAVTADVMETTKQKIKDLGMNFYLSKPLRGETLYRAVKDLINYTEA